VQVIRLKMEVDSAREMNFFAVQKIRSREDMSNMGEFLAERVNVL
jgi:hypothetical protein